MYSCLINGNQQMLTTQKNLKQLDSMVHTISSRNFHNWTRFQQIKILNQGFGMIERFRTQSYLFIRGKTAKT